MRGLEQRPETGRNPSVGVGGALVRTERARQGEGGGQSALEGAVGEARAARKRFRRLAEATSEGVAFIKASGWWRQWHGWRCSLELGRDDLTGRGLRCPPPGRGMEGDGGRTNCWPPSWSQGTPSAPAGGGRVSGGEGGLPRRVRSLAMERSTGGIPPWWRSRDVTEPPAPGRALLRDEGREARQTDGQERLPGHHEPRGTERR